MTLLLASNRLYEVALGLDGGCRQFRAGRQNSLLLADTLTDITKTCAGWGSVARGDEFKVWRVVHHFPDALVKEYLNLDSAIETAEFVKIWLTAEEAYQSVTVISFFLDNKLIIFSVCCQI